MDHLSQPLRPDPARREPYELRFVSLYHEGRGFAFPCNAAGDVDHGALGERARQSLARALGAVGRELSAPIVRPALGSPAH